MFVDAVRWLDKHCTRGSVASNVDRSRVLSARRLEWKFCPSSSFALAGLNGLISGPTPRTAGAIFEMATVPHLP